MLTVLIVLVSVAAATVLGARISFARRMNTEVAALLADARATRQQQIADIDLARLPQPVQRWLRYSNVLGTRCPATVSLRQEGHFRLEGRGWLPFRAEQYFITNPPGFLWRAAFRLVPFISVSGRDEYRSGEASMVMRVASLFPVANKAGGGLNQGDLLRFLGEVQWFPAAAFADYIVWAPVDEGSARATMTHAGVSASMTFRFGADGRLLGETAVRYNDSRRRNELWINENYSDREFGTIRAPASGEARWEYEDGPYPYIRWRITTIEYDRFRRFDAEVERRR